MLKETLEKVIADFVRSSDENSYRGEYRYFDTPLIGYAAASDPIFNEFKKEGIVGPQFMTPKEWLPTAQTVISIFMPATEYVRTSNYDPDYISDAWMHTRFKGDPFIFEVRRHVIAFLEDNGSKALAPVLESTFKVDMQAKISNWSERHIAYAAGLGTFSRSRGLITKNGMAGRFGSFITNLFFEPTIRSYQDPFANCILCDACAIRCPGNAITKAGQDKELCAKYLIDKERDNYNKTLEYPYAACGKCQTNVPCEYQIP